MIFAAEPRCVSHALMASSILPGHEVALDVLEELR